MDFPDSHILTSTDLCEIVSSGRKTRHFCFILGSGASVESGIPSGNTLEMRWMDCLMGLSNDGDTKARRPDRTRHFAEKLHEEKKLQHTFDEIVAEWETAKKEKRSMSSKFYFDIYLLRFHPNLREGYRYLEKIMDPCEPSLGYHPLALMLSGGNRRLLSSNENRHNLVITTNFDSLVEDSLFLYTDQRPLVISHESLAAFIDPDVQRPIVAKVHRGLMYGPFNSPDTTEGLQPEWKEALDYAFKTYTPIVVGYGGGDGSLMSALQEATFRNGIYWCYRKASGKPEIKIQDFVAKQNGCLVEIEGFDALMMELGIALYDQMISPDETRSYFEKQSNRRMENYTDQWNKLKKIPHIAKILEPISKAEEEAQEKRAIEDALTYWDYFDRAYEAAKKGDHDTAITEYNHAIEKDPTRPIAYYNRGNSYHNLGQHERAIEDYNKAIELDPNYAAAYYNRGISYHNLGQYERAIQNYDKAIELEPNSADAYNNRGNSYHNLSQHERAIQDYDKAIELDPNYAFAYNNRGISYKYLGQYERAIQDYDKAIELDPNYADAYNNRGNTYLATRMYEKAIDDCTIALRIRHPYPECHHTLASIYFALEKYQDAVDSFTTAIDQFIETNGNKANLITTYKDRAKAYRALGEIALAEADEAKVEELKKSP